MREFHISMAKNSGFRICLPRPIRGDFSLCIVFLVLVSLSLQARVSRAQTAPEEVEALKQIAAKLKIPKTLWHFDVDPCTEWERIAGNPYVHNITCKEISLTVPNATTNDTFLHVIGIEIKAADLTGVLPEEIGKLKYLTWIDLSRNYINGTIPAANWSSLPLTNLNLLANRISGVIPEEIGKIKTLETLFIESNFLHGSLPPSLGNLTNLKRLLLSCNNFSGPLPEAMANMKNITEIRLDSTEISGKIPRFFGNLTKLRRLDLQGTEMEGPFPPEFGSLLRMAELRVSDLKNVGGAFPPLEKMLDMQHLVLRNCSLSGSIPAYIGKFEQLQTLDLSFNNLTGEIPTSLENLGLLTTMFLTSNRLTGTIPEWVKKPQQNMDISYNSFTNLASAPLSCEQETRNYVASFSSTVKGRTPSCLVEGMPCNGTPKNYEFFVNCGGESVVVDGKEYERDIAIEGISKYFVSPSGKWAYSSTGNFVGGNQQKFTAQSGSNLTMPNSQLYMSARLNPLSLKYYGLCLQSGNYTVQLHFAEIIFLPGPTYWSLGRRVFDVSIQGKKVLEDFNIAQAANGIGKEVVLNFTVLVENGTLEIHLEWAGKGTNSIPYRSVYGPLISAISVTPNFKPRIFKDYKLPLGASIGIAIASTVLAMTVILGVIWFFLRKKAEEDELAGFDFQNCYRLKQIKAATGNFAPENKIGEGGFGPVYKGVLPDGSMIAVKQLSAKSKQGNREFITEVGMISGLDHPNLVKLYGCCVEGHQLLLIYEYMENNCLARALFGPENARLKLDWATRHKICVGVARGLAYLHGESRLKIIHRDIKATNVLLDKDLNAKISDFGLAKLDEEEDTHISTRIAGTMGYMAPEYAMRGYLTDKADVYSFGVVVLELVSGKNNTSFLPKQEFMFLLDWAYVLEKRGKLLELVDPTLGGKFDVEEAQRLLNLGILCASPSPALRPPMASVVAMLEGRMPVEIPAVEFSMGESMDLGFTSSGIISSNGYGNSQSMSLPATGDNFMSSPPQSNFHSATSRLLAENVRLR